jgi:hypothetical protein
MQLSMDHSGRTISGFDSREAACAFVISLGLDVSQGMVGTRPDGTFAAIGYSFPPDALAETQAEGESLDEAEAALRLADEAAAKELVARMTTPPGQEFQAKAEVRLTLKQQQIMDGALRRSVRVVDEADSAATEPVSDPANGHSEWWEMPDLDAISKYARGKIKNVYSVRDDVAALKALQIKWKGTNSQTKFALRCIDELLKIHAQEERL